jgi:hypothetical protein
MKTRHIFGTGLVVWAVLTVSAPAAFARGGGWHYVGNPGDFGVRCPQGPLAVHTVTAKEYFRTTELSDGTTLIQVTGSLKFRLTNRRNHESTIVNASGPSVGPWQIQARSNGDLLFTAVGRNFGFAIPGLPDVFVSSGPLAVLFTDQGPVVQRMPHQVVDLCALLGAE